MQIGYIIGRILILFVFGDGGSAGPWIDGSGFTIVLSHQFAWLFI